MSIEGHDLVIHLAGIMVYRSIVVMVLALLSIAKVRYVKINHVCTNMSNGSNPVKTE